MKDKLTKQEMIEIELLINHYDSLVFDRAFRDEDEGSEKGYPHVERDTLIGLIKLKNFYNKKFA